jgi:predicted GIY-YIG superfamily endonuclease
LENLIFIGNPQNILASIMSVMSLSNPCKSHIDFLMDEMNERHRMLFNDDVQDAIVLENCPAYLRQLPTSNAGHVYLLVSSDCRESYVGESGNVLKRLWQHNHGYGATSTRHHNQWSLLGLVSGFESFQGRLPYERKQVEGAIHREIGQQVWRQGKLSPMQTMDLIKGVVARLNQTEQYNGRLVVSCYTDMTNLQG